MAKKVKKISINALEEALSDNLHRTTDMEWHGLTVTVKHMLPLEDVLRFVTSVASGCFKDDGRGYMPEIKDFLIDCNILELYCGCSLPANTEKKYELVCAATPLIQKAKEYIDAKQFNGMLCAIEEKTDYLVQTSVSLVNTKMNDVLGAVEALEEKMSEMFANVTPEDMDGIVKAFGSGSFDEEKVVKTLMKQKYGEDTGTE